MRNEKGDEGDQIGRIDAMSDVPANTVKAGAIPRPFLLLLRGFPVLQSTF
jgi:hypothetical protein